MGKGPGLMGKREREGGYTSRWIALVFFHFRKLPLSSVFFLHDVHLWKMTEDDIRQSARAKKNGISFPERWR